VGEDKEVTQSKWSHSSSAVLQNERGNI